jgi:hypothetical protein
MFSPFSWFQASPDPWDNRRRGPRLGVQLPLQLNSQTGELVNLSETGLRLNSASAFQPGELVLVCPDPRHNPIGRRRTRCRVVWCGRRHGQFQLGLGWNDRESWLQHLWQRIRPDWQVRRHLRLRCQFPLEVRLMNGRSLEGSHCLDLSLGGCLLRVESWVAPGTRLLLTFGADRSLTLCGEVLKARNGQVHVRFCGPKQARLRGFLSNLRELQAECPSDPLVELPPLEATARSVAPFACPLKECGPVPRPRSPQQIFGDRLALPEVVSPLKLRRPSLRGPSLWAARHLPLRPGGKVPLRINTPPA